jgi:hypothetical protein
MSKSIQLKIFCYLLFISLIYTGCNDASTTVQKDGIDLTKKDSSSTVNVVQDRDEYQEEQEINNMLSEMTHICETPVVKDTVFIIGSDSISLAFNHSCTGDSFLLPSKYIETYKMDRFMAHSLKSDVIIEKNGVRILDKRIEKKDFGSLVDGDLKKYAVLLYPNLGITGDTIYINYSISVPLTDVGIGVRASILKDGSIQYGKN